jgi:hypothetical protein
MTIIVIEFLLDHPLFCTMSLAVVLWIILTTSFVALWP